MRLSRAIARHVRKYFAEDLLYDATNTIDPNRHRITVPSSAEACVLFLGDSYTFGEGVYDDKSLPFRVSAAAQGSYQVHNLGFHGYGPHQMMAAVEQGLIEEGVRCTPRFTIYQFISDHVGRVAGRKFWDKNGPRYRLIDGEVLQVGRFSDDQWIPESLARRLNRSYTFKQAVAVRGYPSDYDMELTIALIEKLHRVFEEKFPGNEFHVLAWEESEKYFNPRTVSISNQVIAAMLRHGMRVHFVSSILPGYLDDMTPYIIDPREIHPNAYAYELLSGYVVDKILSVGISPGAVGHL